MVKTMQQRFSILCLCLLVTSLYCNPLLPAAQARSIATPWSSNLSFQNLVYGSTTPGELQQILGRPPDNVVKDEQMTPVIEDYYYFDKNKAATVFVFENSLLVGLLYKSPNNQFIDISYILTNNGDRIINNPILGNTQGFYTDLPLYWFY